MNSPDSIKIVDRFFVALDTLKSSGVITGYNPFYVAHSINRMNVYKLEKDHSRNIFQVAWLTYLVEDYGVSPVWLLTGSGPLFLKK